MQLKPDYESLKPPRPAFETTMTRKQTIFGVCYAVFFAFVLPIILGWFGVKYEDTIDEGVWEVVYYGVSFFILLAVYWNYLRQQFENLTKNVLLAISTLLSAYFIDLLLTYGASIIMTAFMDTTVSESGNNEALFSATGTAYRYTRAMAIYIAPVVEETLFRGVIFGSLRKRNRAAAYIVSILAFSIFHVWQFVLIDPAQLIYLLSYLPVSFVLAWSYERTNSLWTSIAFHFINNYAAYMAVELLM